MRSPWHHRLLDRPADTPQLLSLMQRVAATLFIVGGLTSATGVVITQRTPSAQLAQAAGAAALVLIGLVIALLSARRRLIEAGMFASIGILGVSMALLNPVGMMPFFFLWPIVYAAYFCSTRTLVSAFGLMVVVAGGGIAASPHITTKLDTFEGMVVSVGLMGALVALMQNRERQLRLELEHAATVDPVTGLLNRRALAVSLERHLDGARSPGARLAFVMFDVDHFKRFNDDHGHLAGDEALQRVASVLTAEAPTGALTCRFGGEEFAVAIPGGETSTALAYTRRVASRLAHEPVDASLRLSLSGGVCALSDAPAGGADGLMAAADEALYAAKAAGRSRVAWWAAGRIEIESSRGAAYRAAA